MPDTILSPHERAALHSQRAYLLSTIQYIFPKMTEELYDHMWGLVVNVLVKCIKGDLHAAEDQEALRIWLIDNHALLNPVVEVMAVVQPFEILLDTVVMNLDELLSVEDNGVVVQTFNATQPA